MTRAVSPLPNYELVIQQSPIGLPIPKQLSCRASSQAESTIQYRDPRQLRILGHLGSRQCFPWVFVIADVSHLILRLRFFLASRLMQNRVLLDSTTSLHAHGIYARTLSLGNSSVTLHVDYPRDFLQPNDLTT